MPDPVDKTLSLEELAERVLRPAAVAWWAYHKDQWDREILDNYNNCFNIGGAK